MQAKLNILGVMLGDESFRKACTPTLSMNRGGPLFPANSHQQHHTGVFFSSSSGSTTEQHDWCLCHFVTFLCFVLTLLPSDDFLGSGVHNVWDLIYVQSRYTGLD